MVWRRSDQRGFSWLGESLKKMIVSLSQRGDGLFAGNAFEIVEKSVEAFALDQVFPKVSDRHTGADEAGHASQSLRINRNKLRARIGLRHKLCAQLSLFSSCASARFYFGHDFFSSHTFSQIKRTLATFRHEYPLYK